MKFHHEEMSCKILDYVVKKYSIDLSEEDLTTIKNYILGIRVKYDFYCFKY